MKMRHNIPKFMRCGESSARGKFITVNINIKINKDPRWFKW